VSALRSHKIQGSGTYRPFCTTPGCKARHRTGEKDGGFRRAAEHRLFLLDHPIGAYCAGCTRDMKAAYHSAMVCHDDATLAA
jgi:hypothetical protein